jgi:K+ transporter
VFLRARHAGARGVFGDIGTSALYTLKAVLPAWQEAQYAAMVRNASHVSDYFGCRADKWSRSDGRSRSDFVPRA